MAEETKKSIIGGETMSPKDLGTAPIGKLLRFYALPSIIGTTVNVLYNVVDRIFISQGVGSVALSGLAATLPVMTILQSMGVLIGAGAAARISILLGQKKKGDAEELLGNAFFLSLILNVVFITSAMIFMRPLLLNFGASEASLPYAMDYLMIVVPGSVFSNLTFSYNAVMRATGYPRKAMYTMLIGAVLNFILDPLFIFGFKLGIRGAGYATVISMFIGMIWVLNHFLSKGAFLKIRLRNFKLKKRHVLGIVSIGVAPFLVQVLASMTTFIKNTALQKYGALSPITLYNGDLAVASFGIVSSIAMLIIMVSFGLSHGMQPIIGYNFGAGNMDRVKKTFSLAAKINVIVGVIGALIALMTPDILTRIFTSDPELIHVSRKAMSIELLATWSACYQITSVQFFQSIGSAGKSIMISLSRQLVFLIPLLILLPRIFGVEGVWYSTPISDFMSAVLSVILVRRYFKKIDESAQKIPLSSTQTEPVR